MINLHDVDLFQLRERINFLRSRANDPPVVLHRHSHNGLFAVNEPVRQHHRLIILVQGFPADVTNEPRLGAMSVRQRSRQFS